ncbi:hypothetical protein [Halomonas sp. H10-9-1]|uniref:hypothetical protein n=1 Tax=Halomonas sp. H10-9-1 TaxID=2950871 RepID=UPI0032DE8705
MCYVGSVVLVTALTAVAPWAMAQASEADPLDALSTRFLDGYEAQDSLQVLQRIADTLEPSSQGASIFPPTSDISPLAMAVLALETAEGPRDRVRYRITHRLEALPNPPKASPLPLSLIQVDRFSMGAAIHQDVIDAYGAEHAAPLESFDAGPHVSWRLITHPVQGMRADILAAGRVELSDTQAESMNCLNSPCLSLDASLDNVAPWGEMTQTSLALEAPYPVVHEGLPTPATAIDPLAGGRDVIEIERLSESRVVPEPFMEGVIELNLGQGTALNAGMRRGGLLDDSIAAIWKRLIVMPTGNGSEIPIAYGAQAYECQRGPTFSPAGEFCP